MFSWFKRRKLRKWRLKNMEIARELSKHAPPPVIMGGRDIYKWWAIECPDCGDDLVAVDGTACANCGHVFWTERATTDDQTQ